MTTVDEIEAAVARLGRRDRSELMRRLSGARIGQTDGKVDTMGHDAQDHRAIANSKPSRTDRLMAGLDRIAVILGYRGLM